MRTEPLMFESATRPDAESGYVWWNSSVTSGRVDCARRETPAVRASAAGAISPSMKRLLIILAFLFALRLLPRARARRFFRPSRPPRLPRALRVQTHSLNAERARRAAGAAKVSR